MVSKNQMLFVARLSGFWRFETKSFPPEQKAFHAGTEYIWRDQMSRSP